MTRTRIAWLVVIVGLAALPFLGVSVYLLHIAIQILLWGMVYTAWALMGRFGMMSLGHGGFLGIGAYVPTLLWNYYGLTPWIGIPLGVALAVLVAVAIGFPCFHLRVVGHYFALVTLALSEVTERGIVAARDITGGSLGLTPRTVSGASLFALQFPNKRHFFLAALVVWLVGLWVWHRIDGSMTRLSVTASADEDAAAAVGINVTREKLKVLMISAALTALGGSMLGQYLMYVNPGTLSGVLVTLQMLFAAVVGGMYTALGPTVGSALTITLTESLRILFGTRFIGAANTIYGILLVVFTIFMPVGIWGFVVRRLERWASSPAPKSGLPGAKVT
jgi:branched-chain amino acid transport system permease protein